MDEANNNNQEPKAGKWAWVVTGVVIVAVALGFYFWPGSSSPQQTPPANTEAENTQAMQDQPLSLSDNVSDIETDLNNTSVDNLDKELPNMEAEVNAQ